jgi:hypothetical protein
MKTMNNIYEAPKAEVIEMSMSNTVLTTSGGNYDNPDGPGSEVTF